MLKLTTINNKLYFHVISKTDKEINDVYISYIKMYNLIINQGSTITIKEAIPAENEKNYKPRPEVVGKIDKNKDSYFLKIGIGKEYKNINSITDISKAFTIKLDNYEILAKFVIQDVEKFEEYEVLKKELKHLNTTKTGQKDIKGF